MVKTTEASSSASASNEVKYTGVRKRKWGKYVSEIRLPNSRERIWLGSYDTAEKAARAFDAALFCLRGPNAKFNFPEDPPDIPGGRSLSPSDVQTVAQQYASNGIGNQPASQSNGSGVSPTEVEDVAQPVESMDWSFLDVLDTDRDLSRGHVSDFDYFPEPGEMYMPSSFYCTNDEDEEDRYGGSGSSFLWNF